jgi:two-component system, NtrC family, sensor kinase
VSLRSRLLIGLTTIVLAYGATVVAVQMLILGPSFESLERETVSRNLSRTLEAIAKDEQTLEKFCHDWAAWDDCYRYVQDGNQDFVHQNLEVTTFSNGNFDLVWFVAKDGRVIFGQARDALHDWAPLPMADFPAERFPLDSPLLVSKDIKHAVTGLMGTTHGPMIVSSWPVTDSLQQSAAPGWLIMGRFLDAGHVEELSSQTRVPIAVQSLGTPLADDDERALHRLVCGESDVQETAGDELRHAWATLPDLAGHPVALLRIDWPRDITRHGARALRFALFSLLAGCVLIIAAAALMLQRAVIRPLLELTRHAVRVGSGGDLGARLGSTRPDELGVLAREFDAMVGQLAASRTRMVDDARQGGRAEVATAVLHNVGNVLNSVNVSRAVIDRELRDGVLAELEQLETTLAGHEHDLAAWMQADERGRLLPPYLLALVRQARTERAALAVETGRLSEGLEHISALVAAQQRHATGPRAVERVSLTRQVESALALSDDGPTGPPIEVRREFEDVPDILVPRHRLLEVLVNLLRNARQSLRETPQQARRLVVRVVRRADRVRVEVVDNGLGIAQENLTRIFQQRFTTRRDGHGIGLHSAANAAREMGGSLSVHSDGPGTGATFVLELPLAPTAEA